MNDEGKREQTREDASLPGGSENPEALLNGEKTVEKNEEEESREDSVKDILGFDLDADKGPCKKFIDVLGTIIMVIIAIAVLVPLVLFMVCLGISSFPGN